MDFLAYHENKACDLVKEMLFQIKEKMKELGLRTLRVEDDHCVIIYNYDERGGYIGLNEFYVHGIHLDDDDELVLHLGGPESKTVRIKNECKTSEKCPKIVYDDRWEFIAVDSEDLMIFSLLNLSTPVGEAFESYERKMTTDFPAKR